MTPNKSNQQINNIRNAFRAIKIVITKKKN